MPGFGPTYLDYLRLRGDAGGGSESGGFGGVGEAQWNAMSDAEKANNIGGGFTVTREDPRYAGLLSQLGGEQGRGIRAAYGDARQHPNFELNNPNAFLQQDGYSLYKQDNMTPGMQRGEEEKPNYLAFASSILGPMLGGYLSGAGMAGGAGADALATSVGGGFGTGALGAGGTGASFAGAGGAYGAGAGAAGLGSSTGGGGVSYDPIQPWEPSQFTDPNFTLNDPGLNYGGNSPMGGMYEGGPSWAGEGGATPNTGSGWNGSFGDTGGLDPNTLNGQGGMSVGQNGIGPGAWKDVVQGSMNNPSSLVDRAGGLLGDAGKWAVNNPMRAYSLYQMGSGLINRGGSSGGASGGSGGASKGGGGASVDPAKMARPQWQQNPYLAAQLQRGGYQ